MGSVDQPDQPEEPSRAERARDDGADRPPRQEMPDPDERGRAYEAMRVHASADATDQGSYWDKVPRFRQMWADHERRWPERQPAAEPDRPADPPGTYRSRGGFKLTPERHAETIGAIGRLRETEPDLPPLVLDFGSGKADSPLRDVAYALAGGRSPPEGGRGRVSAETACEIVHKASPRKRRPAVPA